MPGSLIPLFARLRTSEDHSAQHDQKCWREEAHRGRNRECHRVSVQEFETDAMASTSRIVDGAGLQEHQSRAGDVKQRQPDQDPADACERDFAGPFAAFRPEQKSCEGRGDRGKKYETNSSGIHAGLPVVESGRADSRYPTNATSAGSASAELKGAVGVIS